MRGVGLCFLPETFVQSEVVEGVLWPVLAEEQRFTSDIYIIALTQDRLQLPTRLFRDLMQEMSETQAS